MLYLASSMALGLTLPPGIRGGLTVAPPRASRSSVSMQIPAPGDAAAEATTATSALRGLRKENEQLQAAMAEQGVVNSRVTRVMLPITGLGLGTIATINAPPYTSVFAELFQENVFEQSRKALVDSRAEDAMAKYFPGALGSLTVDRVVSGVLGSRGYNAQNTLFATSTCPDEVNSQPGELIDLFKNRYGENFALGGLGGVPFTGKAGFSAYAHHVPTDGKMFVMFGPHVGIEFDGKVGQLQRVNQDEVSTACGAAVGAYKAIMKMKKDSIDYELEEGVSDYFDAQIEFIKLKLGEKLKGVDQAPDAQAFVAYQMYSVVREFLVNELLSAPGIWDCAAEVTVLGGIMINRGKGGDRFMPLMLQTRNPEGFDNDDDEAGGTTIDLYKKAFGNPPEEQLRELLGNSVPDLFSYPLDEFKSTGKIGKVRLTKQNQNLSPEGNKAKK